jgi:hypothetical protein
MDDRQATSPATGEQQTAAGAEVDAGRPGFGARGRMRRRARFLRKARELAYRDLGGLVLAKLETIGRIDNELRALEGALREREPVTVLREAGVAACARCAAIHGSEDRFCPNCGLAMDLRAERPMAGAPVSAGGTTPATAGGAAGATQTAPSPTTLSPPAPAPAAGASPAPGSSPMETPTEQQAAASVGSGPVVAAGTGGTPASGGGLASGAAPAGPAPAVEEPTEIIRPSVKSP